MDSAAGENPLKLDKKICVLYVQCSNSILFGFGVTGSHGFESIGGKRQNLTENIQIKSLSYFSCAVMVFCLDLESLRYLTVRKIHFYFKILITDPNVYWLL